MKILGDASPCPIRNDAYGYNTLILDINSTTLKKCEVCDMILPHSRTQFMHKKSTLQHKHELK